MKTMLTAVLAMGLTGLGARAQTCDDHVAAGRTHLANAEYPAARARFESAVALCPDHEEANALLGATRFPAWLETPGGSNFLTRLGIPVSGRLLTDWTAEPPADIDKTPLAPAGVRAQELSDMMRTNLLGQIQSALGNLERVTNTAFLLNLSSNETRLAAVTVDYGDVLMLRAMLHAAEYLAYTCDSWNLEAELSAFREVFKHGPATLETLFLDHPALLTYATTNDLLLARQAFINGCDRYQEASALIRARNPLTVRLFNADDAQTEAEADFRLTLQDLKSALTNATVLWDNTNYTLSLQPHFAGQTPPRDFLPVFRGNRFGLRTVSDVSFGGTVQGMSAEYVDELISDVLDPVAGITDGILDSNGAFVAWIHLSPFWLHRLEGSTNLTDWTLLEEFTPFSTPYLLEDPAAGAYPHRFYRVINVWDNLEPWPDNDWFFSSIWIDGTEAYASEYTGRASKESGEPDHNGNPGGKSVWWTWHAPASGTVTISTEGSSFDTILAIYTGFNVSLLTPVASDDDSGGNLTSRIGFKALGGTAYHIAVDGYNGDSGTVNLSLTMP